jgi:MutS domain III
MSYKSKLASGVSDGTIGTNSCSASVEISLWAGSTATISSSNNGSDPGMTTNTLAAGKTLSYFHYEDHPRQFNHTDALIQRLYPVSVIHIAVLDDNQSSTNSAYGKKRTFKGSSNNDDNNIDTATSFRNPTSKRLVSFLRDVMIKQKQHQDQEQISNRNRNRQAELDPVVVHTNISIFDTIDFPRLNSIVQQLLGVDSSNDDISSTRNIDAKAALLQFTGNTYLQQHPIVAKCLQLYLYSIENAYPNVINSDSDGPDSIVGTYKQIGIHGHLNSHLVLDSIACDAIHLWPPTTLGQWTVTGGTANTNSLAGIITSHTCTVMGKRLLYQWLRQPLINLQQIQYRQDAVYELVQRSVGRDAIRNLGLKLFTGPSQDLSRLAINLQKYQVLDKNNDGTDVNDDNNNNNVDQGKESSSLLTSTGSTRKALLTLYNLYLVSSEKIPRLVEQVGNSLLSPSTDDNGSSSGECQSGLLLKDCLQQLQQCSNELRGGTELCEAVLDLDVAPSDFFVRRDYKEELHDICIEFDKLKDELDQCHASMNEKWARVNGTTSSSLSSSSTIRLESVSNENYGSELKYQFRLPNTNDSKVLTSNFGKSVTIHRILKNGVYFTTNELRQLSVQKADLTAEYDKYQAEIVSQAMSVAATYVSVLYRADAAIALLDALISLAHLASYSRYGYCRPLLTDSDENGAGIELQQARHPCVELQDNTNTTEYIPNDIKLIFGESSFLLVTGPNSKYSKSCLCVDTNWVHYTMWTPD